MPIHCTWKFLQNVLVSMKLLSWKFLRSTEKKIHLPQNSQWLQHSPGMCKRQVQVSALKQAEFNLVLSHLRWIPWLLALLRWGLLILMKNFKNSWFHSDVEWKQMSIFFTKWNRILVFWPAAPYSPTLSSLQDVGLSARRWRKMKMEKNLRTTILVEGILLGNICGLSKYAYGI